MTGETDAHCQDVTLEIMHVSSDSSKSQCPPCTLILVKVHFLHVFQLYAALCWRLLPKHTRTHTHTHTQVIGPGRGVIAAVQMMP